MSARPETRASIRTRYVGPTNYRPSRVTGSDGGGFGGAPARRLTVAWDHGMNADGNHAAAAQAWLEKHNPGAVIHGPGLGFAHEYFWTWTHREVTS